MLSIGEFSNICKVSTKTLRYYAEIDLLLPEEINPENGYRYYSIKQLETMLFINRLKSYQFSLDEIKLILQTKDTQDSDLYQALMKKKVAFYKQIQSFERMIHQIDEDIANLKQGKSIMSYMDNINVELVEMDNMLLYSIRKNVHEFDIVDEYKRCFEQMLLDIQRYHLTIVAPPMVMFHDSDFGLQGLDIEFAISVKESVSGTSDFHPGLCLKTTVYGSYTNLSDVYIKQCEWADKEGYANNGPLFEIYVNDPSHVTSESELITEVYYPVKKKYKR